MASSTSRGKTSPAEDIPEWARNDGDNDTQAAVGQIVEGTPVGAPGDAVTPFGPALMDLVQWCADKVSVNDQDEWAAMEAMVAEVMASDTPDAVFREGLTIKAEDIVGTPITIMGFRVAETDFSEGFPFYVLLDVMIGQPPTKRVVSVGAFKVLAQIRRLDDLGEWPQVCTFTQPKKPTRNGHFPLSLKRIA